MFRSWSAAAHHHVACCWVRRASQPASPLANHRRLKCIFFQRHRQRLSPGEAVEHVSMCFVGCVSFESIRGGRSCLRQAVPATHNTTENRRHCRRRWVGIFRSDRVCVFGLPGCCMPLVSVVVHVPAAANAIRARSALSPALRASAGRFSTLVA